MEVVTAAASEAAQRRVAGALLASGLGPGDRVAVALPPSGAALAVVLGALRRGIVPVPLDPALPAGARAELLADAAPAMLVDSPAAVARLLAGAPAELADAPLARPMHYTSGTTGRRKGVWSGVLSEADAAALLAEEARLWGFGPDDRHLVLSPLHHSAPLRFAAGTLLAGGSVVLPGRFEPDRVRRAVAEHRPTTTFCVPTHLRRLLAGPPGDAAGRDAYPGLRGFRLVAHAGEACPPQLRERAVAAFGLDAVWEFYGATEGQFTACPAAEALPRPGTVGRARPGRRLRIRDDGTIWCAAPPHARFGYWNDPAATAAAWRGDEFGVGDLGRLDADGYLYLDGRRTDLVISGGVNVYPREVERVLAGCPGVAEVAVFGVADPDWGQRVCALVVGPVDLAELAGYATANLGPAQRPKRYHRVAELPRTDTGKVRRVDLPGLLPAGPG